MQRTMLALAFLLFSGLAYSQDSTDGGSAACKLCEEPYHKVITAPKSFIGGAYSAPVPSLDGYYPAKLVDEPMILAVIVDSSGVPCSVKAIKNADAKVLTILKRAMRTWKFKTPKYEGKDICLTSNIPVYVRSVNNTPVIFIPDLSDAAKK